MRPSSPTVCPQAPPEPSEPLRRRRPSRPSRPRSSKPGKRCTSRTSPSGAGRVRLRAWWEGCRAQEERADGPRRDTGGTSTGTSEWEAVSHRITFAPSDGHPTPAPPARGGSSEGGVDDVVQRGPLRSAPFWSLGSVPYDVQFWLGPSHVGGQQEGVMHMGGIS
ncbi:hypothetical protein EDB89DRAFT_1901739 [Lactarius sanguifluus]|nr:hypothetical protein EDB89DRAFT_1901739 [Lactarius sanguifluus]